MLPLIMLLYRRRISVMGTISNRGRVVDVDRAFYDLVKMFLG